MRRKRNTGAAGKVALALAIAVLAVITAPTFAGSPGPEDDWGRKLTIYGWLPDISGTLRQAIPGSGDQLHVDASTLLDNLDMTAMLSYEAGRGDWSLVADLIYLNESAEQTGSVTAPTIPDLVLDTEARLDLTAWIVSAGTARKLIDGDRGSMNLTFMVRYFSMDTDLDLQFTGPLPPELSTATFSSSGNLWDGVVGIRGQLYLGEHWYMPYHLDAGTGESSFTWQALGGIGYRFRWGSIFGVYRGLGYDQRDNKPVEDFKFTGPALAVKFHF